MRFKSSSKLLKTVFAFLFITTSSVMASDLEEAKRLQSEGEYRLAASFYEKVLKKEPQNSDASVNLGYCYERQGNFKSAAEKYSLATGDKKTAELLISRGICYIATEDWEKAGSDFEEAIRLEKENALAAFGMGVLATQAGKQAEGQKLIETALKNDPVCFERFTGRLLGAGNSNLSYALHHFAAEFGGENDNSRKLAELSSHMSLALMHPGYKQGRRLILPERHVEYIGSLQKQMEREVEKLRKENTALQAKEKHPEHLMPEHLAGHWIVMSITVLGNEIDLSGSAHTGLVKFRGKDMSLIVDGDTMTRTTEVITPEDPASKLDDAIWGEIEGKLQGIAEVHGWMLHQQLELNPGVTTELLAVKMEPTETGRKEKFAEQRNPEAFSIRITMIRNSLTRAIDRAMAFRDVLPKEFAELQGKWTMIRTGGKESDPAKLEISDRTFVKHYIGIKTGTPQSMPMEMTLDATKDPKEIDLIISATNGHMKGVYELEGDQLSLILAKTGNPRPKSLTAPLRQGIDIDMVLKRDKE